MPARLGLCVSTLLLLVLSAPAAAQTRGGTGNDRIDAFAGGDVKIDCGPGGDTVNIGFNRGVDVVNCETVNRRYEDQA